jgi:hypothetical protein
MDKDKDLKHELKQTKDELLKTKAAIWDMLNYANMYVLLLDDKMNIRFANYSLSITLGFQNEFEPIGKCWLDFIKESEKAVVGNVHRCLTIEDECENYREYINDIVTLDKKIITVKWFNAPVNHEYHWTFSFGLASQPPVEVTEDSIRTYYKDILAKDRTMIRSLRDMIIRGSEPVDSCESDIGEVV